MKKRILFGALLSSLISLGTASSSFAGPFDFVNPGKQEDTKGVDLEGMSSKGVNLIITVGKSTSKFSEAAIAMFLAMGMKEEAERLKASLDEFNKKPNDPEAIKKFVGGDASKALTDMAKLDLGGKIKINMSTEELISSFEKVGTAALLDIKAVSDSVALVNEAKGMLEMVTKDPMKYGFSAVGTVNSIIGSGKFIADNVPQQGQSIKVFSEKMVGYFKANKIAVPSAERLQKLSESLLKG